MNTAPQLDILTPLARIQRILNFAGHACTLDTHPTMGFEHLMCGPYTYPLTVADGADERLFLLNVSWLNDILVATGQEKEPVTDTLQLFALLPFTVPAENAAAVCLLLSTFNTLLPVGSFGLNEHQAPYFRYGLKTAHAEISELVMIELVNQSLFFLQRLSDKIEQVAFGVKTPEEAIKDSEIELGSPPPLFMVPDEPV